MVIIPISSWTGKSGSFRIKIAGYNTGKYGEKPAVSILYFVPDKKKDGGSFQEVAGTVRRVDIVNKIIVLAGNERAADGLTLKLEDIVSIEGAVFAEV